MILIRRRSRLLLLLINLVLSFLFLCEGLEQLIVQVVDVGEFKALP